MTTIKCKSIWMNLSERGVTHIPSVMKSTRGGVKDEWNEDMNDAQIYFVFNSDNTESYKEMDSSESIDYSVSSNNKLTVRYSQYGDPQTFTIKELTASTLKLEYHEKGDGWEEYELKTFSKR